jgi:hypothetical protein
MSMFFLWHHCYTFVLLLFVFIKCLMFNCLFSLLVTGSIKEKHQVLIDFVLIICIYNIDEPSPSIFFYSMDKLKEKVLFLIGCMLLF